MLRMIPPEAVREFARRLEAGLFQCLGHILEQDLSHCGDEVRGTAGLPLILGGLGLRSAERMRVPRDSPPALVAATECARAVIGAASFTPPSMEGFGHESTTTFAGCFGI